VTAEEKAALAILVPVAVRNVLSLQKAVNYRERVTKLLHELTEAQFEEFAKVFTPEQMIEFGNIVKDES
jgi:dihydroorotase